MSSRTAPLTDHRRLASATPASARERLTLVTPPRVALLLTFADDVELRQTGPVWRRTRRRFPAGLVHAAELDTRVALCGTPLELLEAFGRSRHPFETIDPSRRCFACHVAAGRPTA